MLDVAPSRAYNLGAQVEARNGFEIDRDALFRPLATTERIALDLLFGLAAAKTALVDEVGQFLFHEFVDFLDGFFEAFFRLGRYMEVEGWVLHPQLQLANPKIPPHGQGLGVLTAGVAMLLSG